MQAATWIETGLVEIDRCRAYASGAMRGRSGGPSPWCIRLVQDRGELRWAGAALGQCVLARHVLVRHRQPLVLRHTCEEEKGASRRGRAAACATVRDRATGVLRSLDRPVVHRRLRRLLQARERGAGARARLSEGRALLAVGLRHHSSGRRAAVARGAGAARGGTRSRRLRVPRHLRRRLSAVARVEHTDDAGARRRVRRCTGHNRAPTRRRRAARGAAHARGKSRRAARARQRAGRAAAGRHTGRSRDPSRGLCSPPWRGRWPRCSAWTPRT